METAATPSPITAFATHRSRPRWIVSGLVILFLAFDGVTKVVEVAPVMEACARLGIPTDAVTGIGMTLLACTALYAVSRTSVLGAILLTGYLGGATAIHVRGGSGAFEIAFAIAMGVLVWLGLLLREPRLFRTLALRE